MTTITKDIANEVIAYFNPKGYTHTFIGDVLEKIQDFPLQQGFGMIDIVASWMQVGCSKSLQEILAEAKLTVFLPPKRDRVRPHFSMEVLASPTSELFEFLHSLMPQK